MGFLTHDAAQVKSIAWLRFMGAMPGAAGLAVALVLGMTPAAAIESESLPAASAVILEAADERTPVSSDEVSPEARGTPEAAGAADATAAPDAPIAPPDAAANASAEADVAAPEATVAIVQDANGSFGVGPLTLSGASTIQPIMADLARYYQERTGAELHISGGGSGRGIGDARAGNSDIGMVSRGLHDAEKADLQYSTIGLDTLVFIVNEANPQIQITRDQLIALYTRNQDWQQLNGFGWPVRLVSKELGRSTIELFEEFSGLTSPDRGNAGPPLISRQATVIGSNLEALTLVGGTRGAVGYVSLGAAVALREQGLPIRILGLGGVTPSALTIQSGQYPIRRELNLVFRERTPAIDALLAVIQSAEGQAVIEQAGFILNRGR